MLFVAKCVDSYLTNNGRLGFVITASVFQSELAGRGFRRRRLESGRSYRFIHIDDMSSLNVFDSATNITSVLVADREEETDVRVPVLRWIGRDSRTIPTNLELQAVVNMTVRREYYAEPADPMDPASPLLMMAQAGLDASRPVRRMSPYLEFIRKGIDTRGANGIFFVEILAESGGLIYIRNQPQEGRNREVPQVQDSVEPGAVRRLLRGADVSRGDASPSGWILWFHDNNHVSTAMTPSEASTRLPSAFEYARNFEPLLRRRRKFRAFDPTGDNWIGIYSVTTAALAAHKVVIREIASGMIAAAVHGSDIIPDHKLYVIPCQSAREANQLSEVLNSQIVDYLLRAFSISTSVTGSFLRYIGIRDLSDAPAELEGESLITYALGLDADQFRTLDQIASVEAETG